jgi:hypothetical protein
LPPIINPFDEFSVVQLTGNTLTLTDYPVDKALLMKSDAWSSGSIVARIIYKK